jgi:hypothetical protein
MWPKPASSAIGVKLSLPPCAAAEVEREAGSAKAARTIRAVPQGLLRWFTSMLQIGMAA